MAEKQRKPFKLSEDERGFLAGMMGHTQAPALTRLCDAILSGMADDVMATEILSPGDEQILTQRKLRYDGAAKLARELLSFLASLKHADKEA